MVQKSVRLLIGNRTVCSISQLSKEQTELNVWDTFSDSSQ